MNHFPTIKIAVDLGLELREIDPIADLDVFCSVIQSNHDFFQRTDSSMADINSRESALKFIQKGEFAKRDGAGTRFGLWLNSELIGQFNLFNLERNHRKSQVGYWLSVKYGGKGYATKALAALVKYGFKDLALHRIEATTATSNHASIRLLERLGFKKEGLLREVFWTRGRFVDDYLYALLENELSSVR